MTSSRTLSIRGLSHSFGSRPALSDVAFDVRPGRLTGFVGANGAGKTTTMRAIMGVLRPDRGTITLGDAALDLDARRRIGYMPEERGLYPKMKVHDQLVYLAKVFGVDESTAKERATALLEGFGLGDRASEMLHTLSLGNQQRVQVAAALIHEPDLLVLDEPFSGLDPIAMDSMAELLRTRADAGVPVLFSSHQLELVERLCDDLVLIHEGTVLEAGDAVEMREKRAGNRYRVQVDGDAEWTPDLPGVAVVSRQGRAVVIDVGGNADPQQLLKAAQKAGSVVEFGRVVPTLAQIFHEEVAR